VERDIGESRDIAFGVMRKYEDEWVQSYGKLSYYPIIRVRGHFLAFNVLPTLLKKDRPEQFKSLLEFQTLLHPRHRQQW
jgi:hypothetical protein